MLFFNLPMKSEKINLKMKLTILVLCLQITKIYAAPISSHQSQQLESSRSLQQQLLALQQLQMLKQLNVVNTPLGTNTAPPLIIIVPNPLQNIISDANNLLKFSPAPNLEDKNQLKNTNNEEVDEELDSVIVNAESEDPNDAVEETQKAILLVPNRGRVSIGGIISAIPFLPIEINVPDTASWIYNWISSIISGIGQRWPLKPKPQETPQDTNLRVLLKQLQIKKQNQALPIIIMPV